MTSKRRASVYTVGILAVVGFGFVDFACSGSDSNPGTTAGTGGSSSIAGTGGTNVGTGGTSSKATGGGTTASGVGGTTASNGGATAALTGGTPPVSTGGTPAVTTGGTPAVTTGGTPAVTTGGTPAVSTGGAPTGGQNSTGASTLTGGTTPIATGGTIAVATGGSTSVGTGGDTSVTSGGTTSAATGGDTSGATGGDTSAATGGTTSAATGGTNTGGGTSTTTCGTFTPPTLPGSLCSGLTTAAGVAPAKNGTCTSTDPQVCYSTCGPAKMGYKSETCNTGTLKYDESACTFPGTDYSCFKIPTTYNSSCPAVPHSGDNCATLGLAAGVVCGPTYTSTSSSTPANGYCICNSGTNITFSCASTSAWPCPSGAGCT